MSIRTIAYILVKGKLRVSSKSQYHTKQDSTNSTFPGSASVTVSQLEFCCLLQFLTRVTNPDRRIALPPQNHPLQCAAVAEQAPTSTAMMLHTPKTCKCHHIIRSCKRPRIHTHTSSTKHQPPDSRSNGHPPTRHLARSTQPRSNQETTIRGHGRERRRTLRLMKVN